MRHIERLGQNGGYRLKLPLLSFMAIRKAERVSFVSICLDKAYPFDFSGVKVQSDGKINKVC